MTTTNENTTLEIAGATLTVDTQALFRAWMEKHVGQPSAPLGVGLPPLAEGEVYAGIILGKDDEPDYHLIKLPGEAENKTWKSAGAWAKMQGGDLPTLRELGLLRVNARENFKPVCYWSSEQHASNSDFAWFQDFDYGDQDTYGKSAELCAVAVRRVVITEGK